MGMKPSSPLKNEGTRPAENLYPESLIPQDPAHGSVADDHPHPIAEAEWLASHILSLTDPRTVCKLALVNRNFLSASISDVVWQKMLPPTERLGAVLSDSYDPDNNIINHLNSLATKKDLYFQLCQSIALGGGLKKFWLDRGTGGECYIISARDLEIAWGSTPQYWEWLPSPGSWFSEVACLRSVCWFDVGGSFRQSLRPGSYVVSFRMQLLSASSWRGYPIKLRLQNVTYGLPPQDSEVFFHRPFPVSDPPPFLPANPEPSKPDRHVWVECDVGEFTVDENESSPIEVHFSMREVERLWWKNGFLLDGVMVRPSYVINARARADQASMGSVGYSEESDNEPISDNDQWDDGVNGDEDPSGNEYNEEELRVVASSSGDEEHLEDIASMEAKDVNEDEELSDDCSS